MTFHSCIRDIEGQRGCLQIILLLNKYPELVQSQLYNNSNISISNNITASRAIDLLKKYDLISERKKEGSNAKYYQLTNKGKKSAELLIQFQTVITQKSEIID